MLFFRKELTMSRKRQRHADKTPGLRLTRKAGERVRLMMGETVVWIDVASIHAGRVTLAFSAPPEVEMFREECLPCEQ